MNNQSLLKRKPKADVAKEFIGVLSKTKSGKPKTLIVPGSNGKQYHVIVRRLKNEKTNIKFVTLECRLNVHNGHIDCQGNGKRKYAHSETICYHSRAAFDYCLSQAGFKGAWCTSLEDAEKLRKMTGGFVQIVKSHQSSGTAFVVVNKVK